jgi:hypothetical protein
MPAILRRCQVDRLQNLVRLGCELIDLTSQKPCGASLSSGASEPS